MKKLALTLLLGFALYPAYNTVPVKSEPFCDCRGVGVPNPNPVAKTETSINPYRTKNHNMPISINQLLINLNWWVFIVTGV